MDRIISFDLDETLMQNPFKGWVFPEVVTFMEDKIGKGEPYLDLIINEHQERMNNHYILEAYDWDDIVHKILLKFECQERINITDLVKKHCIEPKIYLLEENLIKNLNILKDKGYTLIATTNGYHKYQYPVLKSLGLTNVLDEVITSDIAKTAKPDKAMFSVLANLDHLKAHVGDRVDHDVVIANQLNVHSIFINRNLPQGIVETDILKRSQLEESKVFIRNKWEQESRLKNKHIYEQYIYPKVIVQSIAELVAIVDMI